VKYFEEKGHNLVAFGDIDSRKHLRNLALKFGVDYEPSHHELIDVEKMSMDAGRPLISSRNVFKPLSSHNQPVFTADSKVAFQGVGMTLDPQNSYVFPILHGEQSTMSRHIDTKDENSPNTGEQLSLVAGYQSLNNHRAVFTGSMAMCSDEYFAWFAGHTDNRRFCEEMLDWVMGESGVLRVTNIRHQKEGTVNTDGKNPENYFIEDKIEYFATIEQKTKG